MKKGFELQEKRGEQSSFQKLNTNVSETQNLILSGKQHRRGNGGLE